MKILFALSLQLFALIVIGQDSSQTKNIFAKSFFILDDSQSKLKYAWGDQDVFVFSTNTHYTKDDPKVVVIPFESDSSNTAKSLMDSVIDKWKRDKFDIQRIINRFDGKVKGVDGSEIAVMGMLNGEGIFIYQLILIRGTEGVSIQGFAKSEFESNIEEIQKLARTLRFKPS